MEDLFKMNKKEVSEIKKQFKPENNRFTIEKIANAYVISRNGERDVKYFKVQNFELLPENEIDLYLKNCKKALGGRLGKGLVEYSFPSTAFKEDSSQGKLYSLLTTKMNEDEARDYISYLVRTLEYPFDFYISMAYCTYSVPIKKDDAMNEIQGFDDEEDDDGEIFNFIIVTFNESALTDIGLYYNEKDEVVEKKTNTDIQILKAPCDGFMFPLFNDRASDINGVLYYTKTPKKPNEVMITDVLGCEFTMSSEQQASIFINILEDSLGDELTCDTLKKFQHNVNEVMAAAELDSNRITLNKDEIKALLKKSDVSDTSLENFDENYERDLGEVELDPVNLIETNKIDVKAPNISVNVKKEAMEKVEIKIVGGKKQLIIPLDGDVEMNGISL